MCVCVIYYKKANKFLKYRTYKLKYITFCEFFDVNLPVFVYDFILNVAIPLELVLAVYVFPLNFTDVLRMCVKVCTAGKCYDKLND